MTDTYRNEVTTTFFGTGFFKLLLRWKGSIYPLLLADFLVYVLLYTTVSLIYRLALDVKQQIVFGQLANYCERFTNSVPLSLVLGFYCAAMWARWWAQYQSIPWPDALCMNVTTNIRGKDYDSRMMRRTIARYANLAINFTFGRISRQARKRFETLDNFVLEGFLTPNEKSLMVTYLIETNNCKSASKNNSMNLPNFLVPLLWASSIVTKAREESKISIGAENKILTDLLDLRKKCEDLQSYAIMNIPLVYTQIVTFAVYSYFFTTLIGRQFIGKEIDLYVPIFTLLELFFYMGWLKTTEVLFNPFGDGDDDFEILNMIDRNHEVSYVIVDKLHSEHPHMSQDIHWDSILPVNEENKANVQYYANPALQMGENETNLA